MVLCVARRMRKNRRTSDTSDAVSQRDWPCDGAERLEAFARAKDRHGAVVKQSSFGDRSRQPIITLQWCNLDAVDQPESQGRIEIAHRAFVEVNNTTRL
jgi:hypothetical protein